MKEYLMLTKLLLRMQFKPDPKAKGKRANSIALIVLGAVLSVLIAAAMLFLGGYIKEMGIVAETSASIMFLGFVVVLIFGTLHLLSYMYFSPDNEFLMSLPIKPLTVYAAKLTLVYVVNMTIAAVLIVPGLLCLGISANQGALFFVMSVIAIFLVPVFPLLLSSLFAIPLMYVTSLFKHKGAITTVLLLIIFSGVMAAYLIFINNMSFGGDMSEGDGEQMLQALKGTISIMAVIIYPLYSLGRFMTFTPGLLSSLELSMLLDAAIFFGSFIVLAVAMLLLSAAFYRKSALRQLENAASSSTGKRSHTESSAYKSLLKKEWRELIRNPSFAFQCLAGFILVPLITVIVTIFMGRAFEAEGIAGIDLEVTGLTAWLVPQLIIQMMGIGMNFFAMTAITREGKTYEISKTIPVDYSVQMKAKKTLALILSMVPIGLSLLFVQIMQFVNGNYNPVLFFFSLASLYVINYGFTCYALNRDLKSPRLDWSTPAEAVKNNKATLIPFFINMAATFATLIILVIAGSLGVYMNAYIASMIIGYIIIIGAGLGFAVPMHSALKNNTEKYYRTLGDS